MIHFYRPFVHWIIKWLPALMPVTSGERKMKNLSVSNGIWQQCKPNYANDITMFSKKYLSPMNGLGDDLSCKIVYNKLHL